MTYTSSIWPADTFVLVDGDCPKTLQEKPPHDTYPSRVKESQVEYLNPIRISYYNAVFIWLLRVKRAFRESLKLIFDDSHDIPVLRIDQPRA